MTVIDAAGYLALRAKIEEIGVAEGGRMWFGKPDRWYESPHWRCINDHVSLRYLKTEMKGDLCFACMQPVALTFPEDVDGVLIPVEYRAALTAEADK